MKALKLKKEFEPYIGHISQVSKLPYPSWSLSALECKTGSKLAKIDNTICHKCYALSGNYRRFHPHIYDKNLEIYLNDKFVEKFAEFIKVNNLDTFRWFDSGDLQNELMLKKFGEIANLCPNVNFWLPTKEPAILYNYYRMNNKTKLDKLHPNLVIRLSAFFIDKNPDYKLADEIGVLVSSVKTGETNCKVYETNNNCGDCRKCTDRNYYEISYRLH